MTIKFPTANEIRNSMPTQEDAEDMMKFVVIPTIKLCARNNESSVVFQGDIKKCIPLLRTLGYRVKYTDNFTEVSW